jgi:phage antirepressor YoqD-like protein
MNLVEHKHVQQTVSILSVDNGSEALTMSSKEIAELTGKEHFHVKRDIKVMLDDLGEHASKFGGMSTDAYGRPQEVFNLPKDLTITLVSGYNTVMRRSIVKRWQQLEDEKKQGNALALPNFNNPAEAARAWALAYEQKIEAEKIVEQKQQALLLAAPKVEFVDTYVEATDGSKGFRQVAKLLDQNEREFRRFLKEKKVMYQTQGKWVPYQTHIDAKRFEAKAGVNGNYQFIDYLFTAKGIVWIAELLKKEV